MHERIFRILLRLYPAQFRQSHGDQALQLFHDRLRDETGFSRRLRLWIDLMTDLGAIRIRGYHELPAMPRMASSGYGIKQGLSFGSLEQGGLQGVSLVWGGVLSVILCGSALFALEHGKGHLPLQREASYSSSEAPKLRARVEFTYQPLDRSKTPKVRLKAVVLPAGGGPMPTGTINFSYGWRTVGGGTLHDGELTLDAKLPNAKGLAMDAFYFGDANYSMSKSMETNTPSNITP